MSARVREWLAKAARWVRGMAPEVLAGVRQASPHVVGLAGLAAIAVGVWGAFGWQAGLVAAGAPFAGFYVWGQAIEVLRSIPRQE